MFHTLLRKVKLQLGNKERGAATDPHDLEEKHFQIDDCQNIYI